MGGCATRQKELHDPTSTSSPTAKPRSLKEVDSALPKEDALVQQQQQQPPLHGTPSRHHQLVTGCSRNSSPQHALQSPQARRASASQQQQQSESPCRRSCNNSTPVPLILNSSRSSSLKQPQYCGGDGMDSNLVGMGGQKPATMLVAMFNYVARTEGEVSFDTGDILSLIEAVEADWWLVDHRKTKARGYIPSALVAAHNSLEANSWFLGPLSRKEAERQLLMLGNPRGSFLVRESETHRESYSLSVLDLDKATGRDTVKHYRIRLLDKCAGFYITSRRKFPAMQALIDNYSEHPDGLCCCLTQPCPKPLPILADLSYQTRDQWEIPRDQLCLLEQLGSGQFGEVWRALFNERQEVAVKMLKSGSMSRADFLKEARIMKRLRHPKLVQLFAVCTGEDPVFIVTELMSHGSLLTHLRDSTPQLELDVLVDILGQVSSGMAYLETEKFIHRDLAARNILVGDNNSVKVADFGLSRAIGDADGGEYTAKQGAKFPIKWTSPEAALLGRFSIKSDIWSFGIVVFEVVTRGQVPYAGMSNTETLSAVENGYRMPKPAECPDGLYDVMLSCWSEQPDQRPTFEYLRNFFDDFFPATEPSYRLAAQDQVM